MKWAKKLKTKSGQNMSSGPFSLDGAHMITNITEDKSCNEGLMLTKARTVILNKEQDWN